MRTYTMQCEAGEYRASSWLALGWHIFVHRLSHLVRDGKWCD